MSYLNEAVTPWPVRDRVKVIWCRLMIYVATLMSVMRRERKSEKPASAPSTDLRTTEVA